MASQLKIGITAQDEGFSAAMNNATKAASKTADVIDKVKTGSLNARQAYSQLNKATQQLALAYNAMSKEMQQSDIGQQLAAQLNAAKQQTAEMYDFMGDFRAEISNMASDTKSLDQMVGVFQGVNAVVQVGAGLMTQFGVAEDQVNKVQQTMMSLLNIANGLQTIQNLLQEQSVLTLMKKEVAIKINNVRQALNTSLTRKDTAAQTAWNVTKAVGKALLGDFTGLLLVGAAAYTTYALCADNSIEAVKEGTDALDKAKQKQEEFHQAVAEGSAQSLTSFIKLKNEWINLRTEQEKNKFLKDNRSEIEKFTGATNDLYRAFDKLVRNSDKVRKAIISIGEAYAWGKKIEQETTKYIERDMALREGYRQRTWKSGDVVSEDKIKELGLVEGVHYKKTGMSWDFKRLNTLTGAGVAKANDKEYIKASKANTKAIEENTRNYNKRVNYMVSRMQQAQNTADDIFSDLNPSYKSNSSSNASNSGRSYSRTNKTRTTTTTKHDTPEDIVSVKEAEVDNLIERAKFEFDTNGSFSDAYAKATNAVEELNELITTETGKLKNKKNLSWTEAFAQLSEPIKKIKNSLDDKLKDLASYKGYYDFDKAAKTYATDIKNARQDLKIGLITQSEATEKQKSALETYIKTLNDLATANKDNKELVDMLNNELNEYSKLLKKQNNERAVAEIEKTKQEDVVMQSNYNIPLKAFKDRYKERTDESDLSDQFDELSNKYDELLQKKAAYMLKYSETSDEFWDNKILAEGGINEQLKTTQEEADAAFAKLQQLQTMDELFGGHTAIDVVAGSFARLGDALMQIGGNGEIAKAGAVLAAIGQIILSFATASAQAAKLGPLGWIAFVTTGITTLGTVIGTIKRFESGGIVGGSSTMGDKQLVRVNSGEMILNSRQQSHLFNMLDNGIYTQNGTNVSITGKIRGSDIYLSQKNYGKTKALTGKQIGIK
jgi:hypothetical protein